MGASTHTNEDPARTVVENEYGTLTKIAPCKFIQFERAKPIWKILLVLKIENVYVEEVEIFRKRYCGSL